MRLGTLKDARIWYREKLMNYGYGMPAYVNRARLDVQWTDVKATNWNFVYDQLARAIWLSFTGLCVYAIVLLNNGTNYPFIQLILNSAM